MPSPFEKVLVRGGDNSTWEADFFSHYDKEYEAYCCVGGEWGQCIPYNSYTKLLIGTKLANPTK